MEGAADDIIANLRAIIISCKGGLELSKVAGDYKETFGTDIPIKSLGYHSLEEFFFKNPNNFIVNGSKVQAVSKASSHHILSLVNKQKTVNKFRRTKLKPRQDFQFHKPIYAQKKSNFNATPKCSRLNNKEDQVFHQKPAVRKAENREKTNSRESNLIPKKIENKVEKEQTIINETPKTYKNLNENNNEIPKIPFENIEDFCGTLASQLRLSKKKTTKIQMVANENDKGLQLGKNNTSLIQSPFRRSLASNIQKMNEAPKKTTIPELNANDNFFSSCCDTEYVIKLQEICSKKCLPEPAYNFIECHPKNRLKYFICKVKIGKDILLSSYPIEASNEVFAKELASKKAYEYILSLDKPELVNRGNTDQTLSRIYDMIKSKEYGIWHNKLRILYFDMYNEEIHPDWFDLVQKSENFEVTTVEKIGFIIRAVSGNNSSEVIKESLDVEVLAPLQFPKSNQWEVYITNVVSSDHIWCRLIGKDYSETYDSMMTKLELHPPTKNVISPVVGEIYLVNLEESWNRVKILEISGENKISVFLIDIGVDETVKKSQLFYLPKMFFSVAPQALLLSLNELNCLAECDELQGALFHSLLGNTFIAEIIALLDKEKNIYSCILWDTSTAEDVNVNAKLLDSVIKTMKSPTLPMIGMVKEMFVSHIDNCGDIYFQESRKNSIFLECVISTKIKNSLPFQTLNFRQIDPKKLYITQSAKDGLFYRIKLITLLDSNTALMKFIDYGFEEQILIDDLFDLEQTAIDLATIPSQVIRTKLNGHKNITSKDIAKIRYNIWEQSVLVKVIEMPVGSLPLVEILKRSQLDGTLSSITKILGDDDIHSFELPLRKKSYIAGLENTLTRNLPMPNIPSVGCYFNVFVTLAAHPGLFNVQPLSTQKELMELMLELQKKCQELFSKPLAAEEFKIGELYAIKYSDDIWYRAYAQALTGSSFIVCLCDFGDIIEASSDKLMPLPNDFKTFPYQAIRASLAGIAPIEKDWSALDCVQFRELVVEKQFVSQIIEINRDIQNPNYISLGLVLIDTSTSQHVYIHKLLIDKKIAVLKI